MKEKQIIILDFGGQYSQLIARKVRECHVFCKVYPFTKPWDEILEENPAGIILSGGPNSVTAKHTPSYEKALYQAGIPVLGICYGMQLMAQTLGGKVVAQQKEQEYGKVAISLKDSPLFAGIASDTTVWMSHGDAVTALPDGFSTIASTPSCAIAGMQHENELLYGLQFHPEVSHTKGGIQILQNFLYHICKLSPDWKMEHYAKETVAQIKEQVGDKKVLCALSGGVDSAVVAQLCHMAVGERLTCVFVDHGLLRKDEASQVMHVFKDELGMNVLMVDARKRFLDKLSGVTSPEEKREIIGEEFIRVFEDEAQQLKGHDFLAQGTIYPDIIESGAVDGSAKIKSHHNVGGLPDIMDFTDIIEPLRKLFKDEVRALGREIGLPEDILMRQPFPGPGLAVRIVGDITEQKLATLREADAIFREEVAKVNLDLEIGQYFAVLTGVKSVGVVGDARTYDEVIALRAVLTDDFMTADWAPIPHEVLTTCSSRIINEVLHVGRVVYDITSKPPGTIEWE